jgi:hypothetical protein
MNDDIKDERNVRVIRIRLDRVGATLLLIVCCVYIGMYVGWQGAIGFLPAVMYQWKYYMTYDDCARLSTFADDAMQFMDVLKEANNDMAKQIRYMKGGGDGSDEK